MPAKGGRLRSIVGPAKPDPFRVADMVGELLQDAEQTLYLATSADIWTDHPAQQIVRATAMQERWVLSGNRWGKTDWGARECRYWMLGDHPYLSKHITLPSRGWATSDTLDNARELTIPKLIKHLPYDSVRHYPTTQQKWFELRNGSRLVIKSCEQGRGAFQGTGDDFHWWDDIEGKKPDLAYECYAEGNMRIQGGSRKLWTWGTMTPICGRTQLVDLLLTHELQGKAFIYQGSIHDNPHLDRSEIETALGGITEQWMREARELGKVTLMGGSYLFNQSVIDAKIKEGEPTYTWMSLLVAETGMVRLEPCAEPKEARHACWKVWERPREGRRYVVFVEPAGGDLSDEPDWTTIKVFDVGACAEVACLRSQMSPKPTARQGRLVAQLYNHALLGIEANAIGLGVIDNARAYPRLYRRHQIADVQKKAGRRYGWYTSPALKQKMLSDLADLVHTGDITLRDLDTWREMRLCQRFADGSVGVPHGKHDDGIMCAAGALQVMLAPQLDSYFAAMTLLCAPEDGEEEVPNELSDNPAACVEDTQSSGEGTTGVLVPHRGRVVDPADSREHLTPGMFGVRPAYRGSKVWGGGTG